MDLNNPRLKPITWAWLLDSDGFQHEPHVGCLNRHFKEFLTPTQSLHPPISQAKEKYFSAKWLRLSGPSDEGFLSYKRWVAEGCPDEPVTHPYIPAYALNAAYHSDVLGLMCWDGEIRAYMDARDTAFSSHGEDAPAGSSFLQNMISNFEDRLIYGIADLLLQRRKLAKTVSLLVESIAISQSILDTCAM